MTEIPKTLYEILPPGSKQAGTDYHKPALWFENGLSEDTKGDCKSLNISRSLCFTN